MKYALLSLLCLPAMAMAQAKSHLLEGFAQAGYVHELWVISRNVANGYAAQSYNGNGFYIGGGLRTPIDSAKRLGFAASADYLAYNMQASLATDERAQRQYAFLRLAPAVNYMIKAKGRFTFTAQANAGYLAALRDNQDGYLQYGFKGLFGSKAYEAAVGFHFTQGNNIPSGDIKASWHEQLFTIGAACYLGRIRGFQYTARPRKQATKG